MPVMAIAERIYGLCGQLLSTLAGGASLFVMWVLWATTYAPERLGSAEAQDAIAFGVSVVAGLVPIVCACMATARLAIVARDAAAGRIAD